MKQQEIIELAQQIQTLETRKRELCEQVMTKAQHTLAHWSKNLKPKEFADAVRNLWIERNRKTHGSVHFSGWSKTAELQREFEKETRSALKSKQTYYYDPYCHRFFTLKKFNPSRFSRSSLVSESWEIKGTASDLYVMYKHYATSYNGYKSMDSSLQQELKISIRSFKVVNFEDSTIRHDWNDSGTHILNTKFLRR